MYADFVPMPSSKRFVHGQSESDRNLVCHINRSSQYVSTQHSEQLLKPVSNFR